MKSTLFLATLVASLSLLQGCYALTGCPGSAECDPNYVADGGTTGDATSSPETKVGNDSKQAETTTKKCTLDKTVEGKWEGQDGSVEFTADVVFDSAKCQITAYEFGKDKNKDHRLFTADPWDIKEKTDTFIKVVFPGDEPISMKRPIQ